MSSDLSLFSIIFFSFSGKNTIGVMILEFFLVYIIGAGLYGLLEIIWRGWTHWTMLLCGGACFTLMYIISGSSLPMLVKSILSALVISTVEFSAGCLVNITFGWHVWDYSDRAYNILGQVCPLFSLLWFALSVPGLYLCSGLRKLLA